MSARLPCSLVSLGGEEPRLVVLSPMWVAFCSRLPRVVGGTNLLFGAVSTLEERPDELAQGLARRPHAERSRRRAPNGRGRGRSLHPCASSSGRYASVETALKSRSPARPMEQFCRCFPHRRQHARTRRVSDLPPRSGALQLGVTSPARCLEQGTDCTSTDGLVAPGVARTQIRTAQQGLHSKDGVAPGSAPAA